MNLLLNPYYLTMILKSYIFEFNRLRIYDEDMIRCYQNKSFKKIVKKSFNVPFYKNKYQKSGISPENIKKIQDIRKLPFVTKNEFNNCCQQQLIPHSIYKRTPISAVTSGTTGKPSITYNNIYTAIKWLSCELRILNERNLNWRKSKITVIDDLSNENNIEKKFMIDGFIKSLKKIIPMDNIQIFDMNDNIYDIAEKIEKFNPDHISTYPGIIRKLAILKNNGYSIDIYPKSISTVGAPLNKYLKQIVEETFGTKIFESYGATESGIIGFQCHKGNYHINSDMVYVEILDHNGNNVPPGKMGNLVVTRLYSGGTPIIRYLGLDDVIAISKMKCNCGISSPLIKKIYGRNSQTIILPNKIKIFPSSLSEFFSKLDLEYNFDIIDEIQIIQHKIDQIDILIKFDKKIHYSDDNSKKILKIIEKNYQNKFGNNVNLTIKEVKEFKKNTSAIISNINRLKILKNQLK